jgi:hypothetical protein
MYKKVNKHIKKVLLSMAVLLSTSLFFTQNIIISKPNYSECLDVKLISNATIENKSIAIGNKNIIPFKLNFKFESFKKNTFIVSMYIDYKQVDFFIGKNKFHKYKICFNQNDDKNLSIKIENKNNSFPSKLMICISEERPYKNKYPVLSNLLFYNLIRNKCDSVAFKNKNAINNNAKFVSNMKSNFPPIYIDKNLQKSSYGEYINYKNYKVVTNIKYKDKSKLALRLFDSTKLDAENYLVLFTLNNRQIKLNNKDFLQYNLPKNKNFIYDDVAINNKIIKPNDLLTAFLIVNPWSDDKIKYTNSNSIYYVK